MNLEEFSRQLDSGRSRSCGHPDDRLEAQCIQLLGTLERLQSALCDSVDRIPPDRMLSIGRDLLVEVLEFVTDRFGSHVVVSDLVRIAELRDTIRELQSLTKPGLFAALSRRRPASDEFIRQSLRHLEADLAAVLRDLLGLLDDQFQAPARRQEWQSGSRVLLEEFRRHWHAAIG